MKAIMTKFHGPSYVKGSRISATDCDNNRVVLSYDPALNSDGNHQAAAYALLAKMGWKGSLIGGGWKKGTQVWVFRPDAS